MIGTVIPKEKVRQTVIENTAYKLECYHQAMMLTRNEEKREQIKKRIELIKIRHYGFYTSN